MRRFVVSDMTWIWGGWVTLVISFGCGPRENTQLPEPEVGPPTPGVRSAALAPFPADDPSAWVCESSPPPATQDEIAKFCETHPKGQRGTPASLALPAGLFRLNEKNQADIALQRFLSDYEYKRKLGWFGDASWRLTGPIVGQFGEDPQSYGVHPAVRIYYSPEMIDWMCAGRQGEPEDGAMLIKEMQAIDPEVLGIDPHADCLVITEQPEQVGTPGWAVMVRARGASHDGWYWVGMGPFDSQGNPTGNPPLFDRSGLTVSAEQFFGPAPVKRNPAWYPTGNNPDPDVVVPYNEYGAYCLNCHASAKLESTFASFDNILETGLLFRHFAKAAGALPPELGESGTEHSSLTLSKTKADSAWPFAKPRARPMAAFTQWYGSLGPNEFNDALALRLPAQTFDHVVSSSAGPGQFLTSDNCSGCHDATNSNDSTANMLLIEGVPAPVNISPYGEWSASPMGLAGRDPIFFSQLQSETNHLPKSTKCIENTCLHCHGVMGQRQLALDTQSKDAQCRELFAIPPPEGVPFGTPFGLDQVTRWQDEPGAPARYGALARDGISCTVCHHVSENGLGQERGFTGNFLTTEPDRIVGPYQDDTIVPKPMEHALGITPQFGEQIQSSAMCGSCHNILLPIFTNQGKPYRDPKTGLGATYEQTTDLEWQNSVYAKPGPEFRSCQDCHMPTTYAGHPLEKVEIANIESSAFAPTTERLPDEDIQLTPRDRFARHSLHGLNLFLNEMFQQFPLILGARQIDYNVVSQTQPALLTGAQSMLTMARHETAATEITNVDASKPGVFSATVRVTNHTGHFFPSGVGFRRAFLEFTVLDAEGVPLWASGRTNELGVIVDGTTDRPLASERGVRSRSWQPHYEVIASGSEVQIYQELITDSDGYLTTSFLRRVRHVKDNRLRPRGFDPAFYERNPSPYIQELATLYGTTRNDPYYTDPKRTGADEVRYEVRLAPELAKRAKQIRVRLIYQSIPPFYLQERFADATVGPKKSSEIQRLYYLTSHLNTEGNAARPSPIGDWKLPVSESCVTLAGERCP